MDFFQAQEHARSQTRLLVMLFAAAVAAIIGAIYLTILLLAAQQGVTPPAGLLPAVAAGTLLVIFTASTVRTLKLRQGGSVVAEMLGGTRVSPATVDADEKRLVNVVEEMAIAAGVAVPSIYVLPEAGINAFAAGYGINDAVVAVTRGALEQLDRDQLQGVIGHEFSHIVNGDMRLNIRLMGLLFGILAIAIIGRGILGPQRYTRRRDKGGGGAALFGIALVVIGYVGVFFGRLIQAAVSRQREFLADAAAVQFTRNPAGLAGALARIAQGGEGSRVTDPHAGEAGHMFFSAALGGAWLSALATHPPLAERIRRLDPQAAAAVRTTPAERGIVDGVMVEQVVGLVGALRHEDLNAATQLLETLPHHVRAAAHDPAEGQALLFALLLHGQAGTATQRAVIERHGGADMLQRTEALHNDVAALPPSSYLSIIDLLAPLLREITQQQGAALYEAARQIAADDGHTTPFEQAALHVLQRRLMPAANAARAERTGAKRAADVRGELGVLLSAIAWAGEPTPEQAAAAFRSGAESLRDRGMTLQPRPADAAVHAALSALRAAAPAVRRQFVEAAALVSADDGVVHPQEMQLMRAMAEAIDSPIPLGAASGSHATAH